MTTFNWQMVGAAAACGGLLLTLLGFYGGWVLSRAKGEDAAKSATKAHARIDLLSDKLASFETRVASDYASKASLEQMETRVVDAINRLGDRLDRWLDRDDSAAPRRRRRTGGAA